MSELAGLFAQYGVVGLALYIVYVVVRRLLNHISELTRELSRLREEVRDLKLYIKMLADRLARYLGDSG